MERLIILLSFWTLFSLVGVCLAEHEENDIWNRETLTDGFWDLNDNLTDKGVEVGFAVTNIYQQNVRGGISSRRGNGRYTGSYDLEFLADLQQLLGIEGGSVFIHAEGGWPDTQGVDAVSICSYFGVNADVIGNRPIDIVELFYERSLLDGRLTLMIGKIDFTCIFDAIAYADDETSQFLNSALVDNPAIPFPDYCLGMILSYDMTESWYVMGGVADAEASHGTSGFATTFDGDDYFFYILETGITRQYHLTSEPMPGTYRVGFWSDAQSSETLGSGHVRRSNVGVYLSCDQMLLREEGGGNDNQGLGGFVRYGHADGELSEVTDFWSVGLQYKGFFNGRDNDVIGLAVAYGIFNDNAELDFTEDHEAVVEFYYNAQVGHWLSVSPGIQYINNPGGAASVNDAVVLGIRVQMQF